MEQALTGARKNTNFKLQRRTFNQWLDDKNGRADCTIDSCFILFVLVFVNVN